MNLKPARMDDIRMWNYGKLQQFVMEFSESDLEAAEIELQPNEYASVYSAQIALATAIKSLRKSSLYQAMVRSGHLYLVRKI